MKPYELKQGILDKMENELLIEKIKKLENEIKISNIEIKELKENIAYSKELISIAKEITFKKTI
jgi:hypothetical protein